MLSVLPAQVPSTLLYVLGLALCIARTSHVWQLWSPNTRPIPFRLYGERLAGTCCVCLCVPQHTADSPRAVL